MRLIVSMFGVLALSACSLTLPVHGLVQNSTETFVGTVAGHLDGTGDLNVTTSSGVTCRGQIVSVSERASQGILQCADGRNGTMIISSGGRGIGTLADQSFTFTIGP